MKEFFALFLKGAAMGAANVIPGVSGGTVAFVTGIYERLINAVKSCGISALKLLFTGKFKAFIEKIDFFFLLWIGLGVVFSFVTLARLFKYLFEHSPELVYAFFFGLILASIYFVGKRVKKWSLAPIIFLVLGLAIAAGVANLPIAKENDSFLYLILCGVVAMASMIIPGLSGSFVLLIMGNYSLVAIDSIVKLTDGDMSALKVLFPVGIGAVVGLLALSHLLAWIFKNYHDIAVALLTGFVAGSLLIIWPWKNEKIVEFEKAGEIKTKTLPDGWFFPELTTLTLFAFGLMIIGVIAVWLMEKTGAVESGE